MDNLPIPNDNFLRLFNCTEHLVKKAHCQCLNLNSSPDGISFKLLKIISGKILQPLYIIYQHSFYEGIFPHAWKHAVVLPLFKGRGSRNDASFYLPISLCPCLGKLLEKIVNTQRTIFLTDHNALDQSQHSFTSGRLTITNMLHFDATIAVILSKNHAYDVISVDFKKGIR